MDALNCSLIEMARLSRGLSQKEAAERIGISQGKLSKAENQLQGLPVETMHILARVYDYPVDFFRREVPDAERHGFFFRKRASMSRDDVETVVSKANILRIVLDGFLSSVNVPDFRVGEYDLEECTPQQIASDVRRIFRISHGPVSDMHILLENNGVIIIGYDFGTSKIDALSGYTRDGYPLIVINEERPADRKRFTLAHELGHLVMHAREGFSVESKEMEDQANAFASEFLMPTVDTRGILYNLTLASLSEIKRRWKVSMQAILKKSYDLGCMTENRYRNMLIEFSRRGWRVNEPVTLDDESPRLVRNIVDLYKSELGYSDMELMRLLTFNERDYRDMILFRRQERTIDLRKSVPFSSPKTN